MFHCCHHNINPFPKKTRTTSTYIKNHSHYINSGINKYIEKRKKNTYCVVIISCVIVIVHPRCLFISKASLLHSTLRNLLYFVSYTKSWFDTCCQSPFRTLIFIVRLTSWGSAISRRSPLLWLTVSLSTGILDLPFYVSTRWLLLVGQCKIKSR